MTVSIYFILTLDFQNTYKAQKGEIWRFLKIPLPIPLWDFLAKSAILPLPKPLPESAELPHPYFILLSFFKFKIAFCSILHKLLFNKLYLSLIITLSISCLINLFSLLLNCLKLFSTDVIISLMGKHFGVISIQFVINLFIYLSENDLNL